jgi:hypothetical protein
MKCEYGCGQEAKYQLKHGKWCCSERFNSCPEVRRKNSETNRIKQAGKNNGMYGKKQSIESRRKNSESNKKVWADPNSTFNKKSYRKNLRSALKQVGKSRRRTIEMIKKRYPLFYKIEKLRYNPNKPGEKEIQVRCKNHDCKKWFTPTNIQLYERIRNIEHHGLDNSFYYCSDECKNICPLFNLHSDPYRDKETPYTESEYQIFRSYVLKRDNYICQFCGDLATEVHHERPQKLEPFFALDPDYAWSCCEKCHYEKGHPKETECSTGNLANVMCI